MIEFTNYTMFRDDIRNHGLDYAARHTAELGFDSVEFLDIIPSDRPMLPLLGSPENVKKILSKYHLSVACYTVALQLLTDHQADFENQMMKHIDFAAAIGAPMVHHTLVPNLSLEENAPSYDTVLSKIFDSAERIAAHCNKLGITCLYEPQGMYFNGIDGLKIFFDKMTARCHDVGICGDFGNSVFVDVPPELVFERFSNAIKHVHIKDFLVTDNRDDIGDKKAFCSKGGSWICETEFGAGSIRIDKCFEILKQVNYHGKISFEFVADDIAVKKIMENVSSILQSV